MSISVIEFGALQPHWMLARWDASVPHTLERLTNYSFAKLVRTTLCMTQVILPKIGYRQIISLIINCITNPVGQKFTYTELTVPFNSLENSRK